MQKETKNECLHQSKTKKDVEDGGKLKNHVGTKKQFPDSKWFITQSARAKSHLHNSYQVTDQAEYLCGFPVPLIY